MDVRQRMKNDEKDLSLYRLWIEASKAKHEIDLEKQQQKDARKKLLEAKRSLRPPTAPPISITEHKNGPQMKRMILLGQAAQEQNVVASQAAKMKRSKMLPTNLQQLTPRDAERHNVRFPTSPAPPPRVDDFIANDKSKKKKSAKSSGRPKQQ
jgi:hypothetical protein